MISMKTHVMTIGFTPQVFTTFISKGADRVVAIRSKQKDPRTDEVIKELRGIPGLEKKVEVVTPKSEDSFKGLVKEMIRVLNSTPEKGEVFVHIGGGMRHMAAALLYATFFVDRDMQVVCTSRLPKGKKIAFEHETLPSIPLHFKLSPTRLKLLSVIKEPMSLTQIAEALGGEKKKQMPRAHRLLKSLVKDGFLEYNPKTKKYEKTVAGELAEAGLNGGE